MAHGATSAQTTAQTAPLPNGSPAQTGYVRQGQVGKGPSVSQSPLRSGPVKSSAKQTLENSPISKTDAQQEESISFRHAVNSDPRQQLMPEFSSLKQPTAQGGLSAQPAASKDFAFDHTLEAGTGLSQSQVGSLPPGTYSTTSKSPADIFLDNLSTEPIGRNVGTGESFAVLTITSESSWPFVSQPWSK